MNHPQAQANFFFKPQPPRICAQRTDAKSGWGLNLVLDCRPSAKDEDLFNDAGGDDIDDGIDEEFSHDLPLKSITGWWFGTWILFSHILGF